MKNAAFININYQHFNTIKRKSWQRKSIIIIIKQEQLQLKTKLSEWYSNHFDILFLLFWTIFTLFIIRLIFCLRENFP